MVYVQTNNIGSVYIIDWKQDFLLKKWRRLNGCVFMKNKMNTFSEARYQNVNSTVIFDHHINTIVASFGIMNVIAQ